HRAAFNELSGVSGSINTPIPVDSGPSVPGPECGRNAAVQMTSTYPSSAGPLRIMTVHAHPDDESSKGAATTARYVAEGHEVMVVTCTGGEAGSILNPAMDRPEVLENMT